jgi:hypothetical protein
VASLLAASVRVWTLCYGDVAKARGDRRSVVVLPIPRFTDTGQAVPAEDRLPRRLFDPDFLKERANHHLAFFGFPAVSTSGKP